MRRGIRSWMKGDAVSTVGPAHPKRPLALLAAALALFIQAFVVQPHVHGVAGAHGVLAVDGAGVVSQTTDQTGYAPPSQDDECLICQTLASSGATILAAGAPLLAAYAPPVQQAAQPTPLAPAAPALPWQSRAPPLSL